MKDLRVALFTGNYNHIRDGITNIKSLGKVFGKPEY